jgi:hypothetical protein
LVSPCNSTTVNCVLFDTRLHTEMPDLNTVPASPHVLAPTSRRASGAQMPPPPVPSSSSLHILPSNQSAVNQAGSSSSLPSPHFPPSAIPPGPILAETSSSSPAGPIRHPRPLTAADLHLQLEKEQEAVVRLYTFLPTIIYNRDPDD